MAPLDWGLGHATRCIPLIQYLLHKGHAVTLAGERHVHALLEQEFPGMDVIPLRGYRVRYPKKGWMFIPNLLWQLPKIALAINRERRWLANQNGTWDLVISDNRYGLAVAGTKSLLMTHQPKPITSFGSTADTWLSKILFRWIHQFDACWIPDEAAGMGIAGRLSHPATLPANCVYMGPLSRLEHTPTEEKGRLLVLLSGPEPQRSLLEKLLVDALQKVEKEVLFIRGLPASSLVPDFGYPTTKIRFENHLPSAGLSAALSRAEIVVCRSGYSSVMDLLKMQKKAILIPTPGQTEQQYLANHLRQKGWFVVQEQHALRLQEGITQAGLTKPQDRPHFNFEGFKQAFAQMGI